MSTSTPAMPVLRHALTATLDDVEWRDSGSGTDFTLRGHAAVFNALSEDLGGFRELIEPGFFRAALRQQPDVRLLFGHNASSVIPLARTASGTLELREDITGLHVWARVAPTSFAIDLRTAMQRGDIDQMSFAFTIREGGDDWAVTDDGVVVRTLRADGCDELLDVSVVTYPAYTQTDAGMRSVLEDAVKRGRLELPPGAAPSLVAPAASDDPAGGKNGGVASLSEVGGDEARKRRIRALRAEAEAALLTIEGDR